MEVQECSDSPFTHIFLTQSYSSSSRPGWTGNLNLAVPTLWKKKLTAIAGCNKMSEWFFPEFTEWSTSYLVKMGNLTLFPTVNNLGLLYLWNATTCYLATSLAHWENTGATRGQQDLGARECPTSDGKSCARAWEKQTNKGFCESMARQLFVVKLKVKTALTIRAKSTRQLIDPFDFPFPSHNAGKGLKCRGRSLGGV